MFYMMYHVKLQLWNIAKSSLVFKILTDIGWFLEMMNRPYKKKKNIIYILLEYFYNKFVLCVPVNYVIMKM